MKASKFICSKEFWDPWGKVRLLDDILIIMWKGEIRVDVESHFFPRVKNFHPRKNNSWGLIFCFIKRFWALWFLNTCRTQISNTTRLWNITRKAPILGSVFIVILGNNADVKSFLKILYNFVQFQDMKMFET